jgi:HSP20 family molecular chaperone IbpA
MAKRSENTTHDLEVRDKSAVEREGTRPGLVFRPDVDIFERPDAYVLFADLPGANESSVDVRLEGGILTLDARLATAPDASWTPLHEEYRFGSYHREFRLSDQIDSGRVSARMNNGVLELQLPKSAAVRPRTIAVQTG